MKQHNILFVIILVFVSANTFAQTNMPSTKEKQSAVRQFTIEPGIGIHTNFGTDIIISNLIQWNPQKHLSLASYSSYNLNNPFKRDFNGVKTEYNYSLNQKFGVGTTFYAKRSSNTFLLMAGVKYTAFKESLNSPDNTKISAAIHSVSPDYGLMYSLKKGVKKYFFSLRVYIPLYPWPTKDVNISSADGNMNNISLELGVGIKIK